MRTNDLFRFIYERYKIALKKRAGKPKPWTDDKILQQYRFCNVFREWDKVTVWIAENWRDNHKAEPDLWFAMCVARFVNWPDSLEKIGFPIPWDPAKFRQALRSRAEANEKVFTGAYIIPANGPKISYVANEILSPVWARRNDIRPVMGDSLDRFFIKLHAFKGFGTFMTAQVIADLKYVEPLKSASDWFGWAASGPGSRRGLNRVMGYSKHQRWNEDKWRAELTQLRHSINPLVSQAEMPVLHAQDLQNCLCEFDKYERVRLGEGRPRSKYPGQFADLLEFQ